MAEPTKVRVYYADSPIGLYSCALLCQLGYTVIVDRYYKDHPILKKFHHLVIDENGSLWHDWTFDVAHLPASLGTSLVISRSRSVLTLYEYIKDDAVDVREFVGFCIYHWGLMRGGRPLYESPVYVDRKAIEDWELTPYVAPY